MSVEVVCPERGILPPSSGREVEFGCEEHKPPILREATTQCVADMTDEEREEYFLTQPADRQVEHKERKMNGYYKRCSKTDWCKKAREKKEQKEKEKDEALCCLQQREAVWVEHAKQQEATIEKLRADIEKLASIVSQLI